VWVLWETQSSVYTCSGPSQGCFGSLVGGELSRLVCPPRRVDFFTRIVLFAGKTSKCVYSQLYGEDKQVGSAHHQPESRNSSEKGHNRYKYRTGSSTRPTPTQSGLYGGCSNGVPPIHFFQAEHRIQLRSRPHAISGLFHP
jgi:hypothetical protein